MQRLALFALVIFAAACHRGKARIDEQAQDQISFEQNRSLEKDGRFGLSATPGTDSYEGSTVLYQPHPPVEALSELLITSRDFRRSRGEYYAFLTQVKPARIQDILAKSEDLTNRGRQLTQVQREEQAAAYFGDKATERYNERLAAANEFARSVLDRQAAAKADVTGAYGAYCDAKLLEFAVSATLYQQNFTKRPSPHVLCETYYAGVYPTSHEVPYFQGETCTDSYIAEHGAVPCIWNEGVYKTVWFRSAPKKFPETSPAYCAPQYTTVAACFEGKFRNSGFDIFQAYARTDLPLNVRKALLNLANSAREEKLSGFVVPQIYFQFIDKTKLPKPNYFNKTPAQIVSQLQRKLGENESGPFPDSSLDLQKALIFFGERLETDSETGGDFTASESDFHFFVTTNPLLREVKHDEFFVAANLAETERSLAPLLMPRDTRKSEAFKAQLEQDQRALVTAKEDLATAERDQDKAIEQKIQAAINAANKPGLASGFWNTYRIVISRQETALRIELQLREPRKDEAVTIIEKCIDLNTQAAFSCSNVFSTSSLTGSERLSADQLTYDRKTGLLTLTHNADDPVAFGWQEIARTDAQEKSYFQELPLATFAHTSWEWKIFPGQLEGGMNILTGDVTIRRDGAQIIAGSFSWYQRTSE